jgi:hypothetical protein
MRKFIYGLLITALLLSFCSCSSKQDQISSPIVEAYIDAAQVHIDNGDYASAINVLKEGKEVTADPSISAMLDEVIMLSTTPVTQESLPQDTTSPTVSEPIVPPTTLETEPPTTQDTISDSYLDEYMGYWDGSDCNITLSKTSDGLTMSLECISYRVVDFELSITINPPTTETNILEFPFEDDGYGNSGIIKLFLSPGEITYIVSEYNALNDYGIGDYYESAVLTRLEEYTPPTNLEGAYDDVVGVYKDDDGFDLFMSIGYEDETKTTPCAEIMLPHFYDLVTLTLDSSREDYYCFYGTSFDENSSDISCVVQFNLLSWGAIVVDIEFWYEDMLYSESIIFTPVVDGGNAYYNPFYTD